MAGVGVLPKDGMTLTFYIFFWDFFVKSWCQTKRRMDAATQAYPLFGMTPTFYFIIFFFWIFFSFWIFFFFDVIPKEGWTWPLVPILPVE